MTVCCDHHPPEETLTRNQRLVLETLRSEDKPLTAYNLLDRLRDDGLRAPPQIYRALDRLVNVGVVHRLDRLNAFISCNHNHCGGQGVLFAVCDACGSVEELKADTVESAILPTTEAIGFHAVQLVGEVRGLCGPCERKKTDG
ncbi:hypothetical protein B7H23_11340 [Notoacmeibacter marinus]|uniref:Uncharacterized protein n=1 Tax=Notoacmeibacter marinus TaxID=1876515 RepID=A0A231UXK3_9HYPH|nr:transcriptional repressor [Notoacmeibacter marinus]OXT00679.1 hypothetical protein B7H23_11340 [Notoacmeibacter marinus]